ncbi:MAG: hypothetical protein LBH17_01800 [Oscillospiraceae bacterium]|jgi:hypothetical protein|nr:hypothetical protein [Oscillospiraceae bacterium]
MSVNIELTKKEYRRLLDMVFIGNQILNSTRGDDRITDYDELESKIFSYAAEVGMGVVAETQDGVVVPSERFEDGGIYEAIADYEDAVFFEILAEELARRDMERELADFDDTDELTSRIDEYIEEFEENGTDRIYVER